jgi:hypothetical protein
MRAYNLFKKYSSVSAVILGAVFLTASTVSAMKLKKQNLNDLVTTAQSIISGQVIKVTDGFQDGAPFTEVTIKIGEDAKGKHTEGSSYTFRQFGLLKPRKMGNGKVYLGVRPEGFAKWNEGEQVVAFMYKKAGLTGFQTTTGMAQGKFNVRNGKVLNAFGNVGLFDGVSVADMTSEESNLMTTPGAVDAGAFMGLVGKIVKGSK